MPARILIIEDDPSSLELVTYLLVRAGYEAIPAANGLDGSRRALSALADLVLCDLQLPLMNGYEVLKSLRNDPRTQDLRVIALTAFSMQGDRDKVLAAGFNGYMSKPIDPVTFVRDVESYMAPNVLAPRGTGAG